jgi:hypothetical protein
MRLILILFLAALPAQKPLEPVRVGIVAPENEVNDKLTRAVRNELRELGDVALVYSGRSLDYEVRLNAMPVVGCDGYAVAVVVVERRSQRAELGMYAGATPEAVAKYLVATLNREHFTPRREAALSKK